MDPNPAELIRSLSAAKLRDRLDQVEQERKALLVLLRAARVRERQAKPRDDLQAQTSGGVA